MDAKEKAAMCKVEKEWSKKEYMLRQPDVAHIVRTDNPWIGTCVNQDLGAAI